MKICRIPYENAWRTGDRNLTIISVLENVMGEERGFLCS